MNDVGQVLDTIKKVRKERKITQEELAKQLGISRQMYSDYENNKSKMTLEMFFKIVQILDLDIFNNVSLISQEDVSDLMNILSKIQKKMM